MLSVNDQAALETPPTELLQANENCITHQQSLKLNDFCDLRFQCLDSGDHVALPPLRVSF
jgi:hypothetical protein